MAKKLILTVLCCIALQVGARNTDGGWLKTKTVPLASKAYRVVATVMTTKTGGEKLATGEQNDANKREFVALPSPTVLGRKVAVYSPETEVTIRGIPVDDVGPHSTADAYWEHERKPLAESGKSDKYGHAKNKAGIDLSLKLCKNLGLQYPYKGTVIWWFDDEGTQLAVN